ncbi:unnamed protein product [Rotaria socialis]|nr:unnamed protein product [Rotaria socialis]CAF3435148.1 unnamed protein product [Rotaria socialis]CAF3531343.1 unnamed protein product [Rotaria socialis]CAF3751851.1 unnamed protein product [Rotaria socialis]CAF4264761.1 unnamed protein product [Rotaria socialis]
MSISSSYAIGIDVGTGSVRCMIFDDKWTPVVQCQKPILTYHSASAPLEYEQSSTDIWQAICYCVRQCLELGSFTSEQVGLIRSIGFDATCSLVVLDEKYEPVSVSRSGNDEQNIIMWLDHRAHAEATIINSSSDEVLQNFGGKISLEMQPGKLLWLKRNLSKEQWTRANHFFDLPDYLHFRATNQLDRSLCSSVCKLCYRSSETQHGWDEKFWAKFDLDDLMANNGEKLGQLVRKPFSKSNTDVLSKKAADELGLPEGIHIGTPLIDAYAGALGGLACKSPIADAHLSERLIIVAGTSSCFMACSEKAVFVPGVWGPHYNVLIPNLWLSEGGQSAAGKSIDHVIQTHPAYNELKQLADEQNRNTFDVLNEILNNLQQKHKIDNVSLLSNDLHMTIDFHGNRSPLADPGLGATIAGLNFDTSLNNLAVQYLTVVQAVAYDSRHIIETMTKSGHHFRVIQICGGLARLGLLTQIIADVVQMPVYVSEPTNDCVLLGAAICGQLIADNERQVEDLLNNIACPIQTYMPDSKIADFHKDKYEIYRLLQQTEMDNRKRMNSKKSIMNRNNIEKLFHECDRKRKGYLNREDIKVASIRLYGIKLDKYKIERILSNIPNKIHPGLTLDQFIDFVHSFKHQIDHEDQNRETFLILDRTCKGFLNKEDFIRAFERANIKLSPEMIDSAFKQLDVDGDGRVSYRDFDFMMNYVADE